MRKQTSISRGLEAFTNLPIPGPRGHKGESGVDGDRGEQGLRGDKGEQGLKGDKGDSIRGPQGEPGLKGDKGDSIRGDKGGKGDPGLDGRDADIDYLTNEIKASVAAIAVPEADLSGVVAALDALRDEINKKPRSLQVVRGSDGLIDRYEFIY